MTKNRVLVINGPNMELLGSREPDIYGSMTLKELNDSIKNLAADNDIDAQFYQSNIEGEIVSIINEYNNNLDAIIINAAAYTHTSVAILDSLKNFSGIIAEVHISNPYSREEFRHKSYISSVADVIVSGAGTRSYEFALLAVKDKLIA